MATAAKRNQFLNADDLAVELGIDRVAAETLMQSGDFPSTNVNGTSYVIDRSLLESWIRHNAKRVDGINDGDLFADFPTI